MRGDALLVVVVQRGAQPAQLPCLATGEPEQPRRNASPLRNQLGDVGGQNPLGVSSTAAIPSPTVRASGGVRKSGQYPYGGTADISNRPESGIADRDPRRHRPKNGSPSGRRIR